MATTKLLQLLQESQIEFFDSISGVSEEQWNWKSSAERWSVADIAEHIVLAEARLFLAVGRALASPVNPDWEQQTCGKTEFIERVMAHRLGRAHAPVPLIPKGGMTPSQIRERFAVQRADIVTFVSTNDAPLEKHTLDHPFAVFGTLSAYQWLLYIPLHTMRHDKQIAEVKESPGYPN